MSTETSPAPRSLSAVLLVTLALLSAPSCRGVGKERPMPASERGAGLFTANCVACHGRYGAGDGTAAVALRTRPRDLRSGPFYYVSVKEGGPTDADLERTIRDGRTGGEMPAAPWLTPDEVGALVAYVRDLNRLGWIEKLKSSPSAGEMTPSEIEEIATERAAAGEPIDIPARSPDYRQDPQRGRELYMASCASCHGPTGRGDGLNRPLDEKGRVISVRDLTRGRFRGGSSGSAIYRRIACGIPGTPMPAATNLAPDDVWQLVDYVRYLSGWSR